MIIIELDSHGGAEVKNIKIKKGDRVKINSSKLLKSFGYLKDRVFIVSKITKRGNNIYATLSPSDYLQVNIRALIKLK